MLDRSATFMIFGVLAGMAAGYLGHPAPGRETLRSASAEPTSDAPRLRTRGAGGRTAEPKPTEGRLPDEAALGKLEEGLDDQTRGVEERAARCARGWLAVSTLHALAGRLEAFRAAAGCAIAAGACDDDVLYVCSALKWAQWCGEVEALMAAHEAVHWGPRTLASYADEAGHPTWAFDVLAKALAASAVMDRGMAMCLFEYDADRARTLLEAALQADPSRVSGSLAKSIVYQLSENDEMAYARPFVDRGLEERPFDDRLLGYLRTLDPAAAEAQARLRLAKKPEDVAAWRVLAEMHREAGDLGAAADAYREVLALDPGRKALQRLLDADPTLAFEVAARLVRSSRDDELVGSVADVYLVNGHPDLAWNTYARATELDPNDGEWLRVQSDLDPSRMVSELAETIDTETSDEKVGYYARALLKLGRSKEAFTYYERAFRSDPTDSKWMKGLALADGERAVPILEAHFNERPDSAYRQGALGLAMVKSGAKADGLSRLEAAVAREPCWQTYRMMTHADPTRAQQLLERQVREHPDNDEWWGVLGEAYADQGRRAEARQMLEHALEIDPDDAYWRRRLVLMR